MGKKERIFFVLIFLINLFFVCVLPVWADDVPETGKQDCLTTGKCSECETLEREMKCRKQFLFQEGGYATTSDSATIAGWIGVIVDTVMSITGIVFLAIVVFSGIQWMMAGGNQEDVAKAKKRIVNATIGLVIVVGAWAIINFILTSLIFPGQAVSSWGPFSWKTY
ncbi:MAG: pilin [bacterium]|nr:pilin [bacterium]